MAKRGPKIRTAGNSGRARAIRRDAIEPPSELPAEARVEFDRLAGVLRSNGTLDRVDLAVIAEAARVKALLDRAHSLADVSDPATIKVVNILTTQRRGLLRELGLTLQPSRSMIRTNASDAPAKDEDPLAKLIKIHG